MTAKERLAMIQDLIYKNSRAAISELSELCNVTEETIRKDLNKLEEEGVLTRVHGGAILNQSSQYKGVHFVQRRTVHLGEKRIIAQHITEFLRGKNTIFADSSTTVAEALKALPEDFDLTVVSNSTEIFLELAQKNLNLISTGGQFNRKYLSLQGSVAKECIRKYNVDVALISCKALDLVRGVQDSNESEAELKKIMIEQAQEIVLLADHDKFNRSAFVRLMSVEQIHCLVTDRKPDDAWIDYCLEHEIKLIY